LAKNINAGGPQGKFSDSPSAPHFGSQAQAMPEGKTSQGWGQVRDELATFQSALMREVKTQQQTLMMFKSQQQSFLEDFHHSTSKSRPQLPPPPKELFLSPQHKLGGDVSATPIASNNYPVMADCVMPSPAMDFVKPLSASLKLVPRTPDREPSKHAPQTPSERVPTQSSVAVDVAPIEEDESDDEAHTLISLKEESSLASVFTNDDDFDTPAYNVEDFYWKTGLNQKIARTNFFANFTVAVVVFNAVYIGVDSDYNNAQNIYGAHWIFQACSQFFCMYFTWELVVRFLAFEEKANCLKDGWFKFDAFLVFTMILDTWVLMPTLYMLGGGVKIPTQPLRMLRLFKLTRMARLMKAFPELVTMIKGLVRSLRAISSSMILIGLMVYVWAIMMHMLLKEEHEFNKKLWDESMLGFATITQCIWTLLMDGTLMLDNSAPLMTSLLFSGQFNYIVAGAFFMLYALLSAMLILQMLIGVLCDVVSRVGSEQREATAIGLVKQELLADLKQFDGGDGKISQEELLQVMSNPSSKAVLKKLNINRLFLLELQKMMFTKPGQQVSIKSALTLMVMCRGDNPTTVEAMAGGLLSVVREISDVKNSLEKDMKSLEAHIRRDIKGSIADMPKEMTTTSESL